MKIAPVFIATGLLLMLFASGPARATVITGEVFNMTGTATGTAGGDSGSTAGLTGSLTVGTAATAPNWNLSAFSLQLLDCTSSCTAAWDFSGLQIDGDTLDLVGTLVGTWTGGGGKPNMLTATFTDNTTDFTWERDKDLGSGFTFFSSGTGTYSLEPVPEPSTLFLFGSALGGFAAWRRSMKRGPALRGT